MKNILKKLIEIPSLNPVLLGDPTNRKILKEMQKWSSQSYGNLPPNENKLVEYLEDLLKKDTEVHIFDIVSVFEDNPEEVSQITYGGRTINQLKGRKCLIALKRGSTKNSIMFNAHLDTWPSVGWKTNPFELIENDGFFIGNGVADTKGNMAAMIYTLLNIQTKNNMILIASPDEEGGTPIGLVSAIKYLISNKFPLDFYKGKHYLIVGEPTSCQVQHKHPSSIQFEIHAEGIPNSHMVFGDKPNSASEFNQAIFGLFLKSLRDSKSTVVADIPNVETRRSPYKYDTNPSQITCYGALRGDYSIERGIKIIRDSLEKIKDDFGFDISCRVISGFSGFYTNPNNPLVHITEKHRTDIFGEKSKVRDFWKAVCDAGGAQTYFKRNGIYIPTIIIGCGELIGNIHSPKEKLSKKEFLQYQKILERIVQEL